MAGEIKNSSSEIKISTEMYFFYSNAVIWEMKMTIKGIELKVIYNTSFKLFYFYEILFKTIRLIIQIFILIFDIGRQVDLDLRYNILLIDGY